jgi:hypothetical protein
MYLLIFIEILLLVAVILLVIMKRKITRLLKENVKLYEKIYQLRNAGREKALKSEGPYWQEVDPSLFLDEMDDRNSTLLN